MNATQCIGRRFGIRTRDGRRIGHVHIHRKDDPWLEGTFTPAPAFEDFRGLFETESSLRHDQVIPLWETAVDAIEGLGIQLEDEESRAVVPVVRFVLDQSDAFVRL
jgi:hypothetical protein